MKILVVTSTFPRWSGDTDPTFVYELSSRLVDRDAEVHVLAPHTKGALRSEIVDDLNVHRFRYFFSPWETLAYGTGILDKLRANPLNYFLIPFFLVGMTIAVYRLLQREQFSVIHAHWLIPQGFACAVALLCTRDAPPLVCTSHGGDLFGLRGKLPTEIKKWVLKRARRVTVVSNYMREFLREHVATNCDPDVQPMGVDLQARFKPNADVMRNSNELVFVGRLVEKKGVTYLLKAFSKVCEIAPYVRLRIVGDGPLRPQLTQEAEMLGISDKVEFCGSVTQAQLPAIYGRASIALIPSVIAKSGDQEGLGLVTVEALGCNCVVIASDLPAIRDIITAEENGILVKPTSSTALADTIIRLLEDDASCEKFREVARASVVDKFDWPNVAERYRRLLHQATDPVHKPS